MSVYFLQVEGGGPIKVGASANPEVRLCCLQVWSPYTLVMLAQFPGGYVEEGYIEHRFAVDLIRGEWFRPSVDLLSYIEACRIAGRVLDASGPAWSVWQTTKIGPALAQLGMSCAQFGREFGVSRECANKWARFRVSPKRVHEIQAFFQARGITLAPLPRSAPTADLIRRASKDKVTHADLAAIQSSEAAE
jgi:hypothetical protein